MPDALYQLLLHNHMRHKNLANLRLHALVNGLAGLGLCLALSQLSLGGANLGALLCLGLVVPWLLVDPPTAALGLLCTWLCAHLPGWGQPHGVLLGAVAPFVVILSLLLSALLGHIYYHEHAPFVPKQPFDVPLTLFFGPLLFPLLLLLRAGYRPGLQQRLQGDEAQRLLPRRGGVIRNWGRTFLCQPQLVAAPRDLDDLAAAVALGLREGKRIRVMGAGLTWSSFCATDDMLIFSAHLDRVEVDLSVPARPAVWAECGASNRVINAALRQEGLQLPWNVVLENVTIGGTTTMGTHGSGRDTSCMGDLVEAFEVIDARGQRRVLSEETLGAEGMAAARLSLGLFGVIARVRLRVEAACLVEQRDELLPFAEALARAEALVAERDSVELYWAPLTDQIWLRSFSRTQKERTFAQHGLLFGLRNLAEMLVYTNLQRLIARFAPRLLPGLLRLGYRALPMRRRVLPQTDAIHYRSWCELRRSSCIEVGFKVDAGFANVRAAVLAAQRIIKEHASRGSFPVDMFMNVRFIGPSRALLSPAYGPGLTCYIEVLSWGRPAAWEDASGAIAAAWLQIPGALPHWPKEFEHVPAVFARAQANLGPRLLRFRAALQASGVDPDGVFVNRLARRLLFAEEVGAQPVLRRASAPVPHSLHAPPSLAQRAPSPVRLA